MAILDKRDKFNLGIAKLKRILIGTGLATSLATGIAFSVNKSDKDGERDGDKKEIFARQKTNYDAVQINTIDDMYNLFDLSLNFIFAELILEEVPMQTSYDDHGKYRGRNNTIGLGSTCMPLNINDYNNPEAKWYHIYSNPKTFANTKISHEDMLKLVIGWAKYRTYTQNGKNKEFIKGRTILQRMFEKLQGTSLRPNEFSAIFCACYNNEGVLNKLCSYVHDNYTNPIDCANKLMFCSKSTNPGLQNRCILESMVYLNIDDFCSNMMTVRAKPSCLYVKMPKRKKLTPATYRAYSKECSDILFDVIYKEKVVAVCDICKETDSYFSNKINYTPRKNSQELQQEAFLVYVSGDYEKALDKFLYLETHGICNCDLYNNIAATYLNLKQYEKCIEYCRKVMKSTEYDKYVIACYNAGCAYEAIGDLSRALRNYNAAKDHYEKYGISDAASGVNYEQMCVSAIARINSMMAIAHERI